VGRVKRHGRREPYTEAGIRRVPCFRCGARARHQWRACADGLWRPLCLDCDIELNRLTLVWMAHPDRERLMAAYEAKARG
jgi:hypothetical protein